MARTSATSSTFASCRSSINVAMGRVECPIVKYVLISFLSRVGVHVGKQAVGNPMVVAEELGAAILGSGGDAIIAADAGGVILFWNPGAERIFGFTAAEAVGQSLDLIIPQALRQRHWDGYHNVMRTGQSRYGQGDLLASRHAQRWQTDFVGVHHH